MADLSDLQSSLTVKIAGADSSGLETNFIDATVNGLKVDGSAVTQPISASSLPLPTGAATETTLSALNTKIFADASSASGTISALNGVVSFIISGMNTVNLAITGTWTATLSFQVSMDNTNWSGINALTNGGVAGGATTNRGDYTFNVAGFFYFRVIATAYTSGTASLIIGSSKATPPGRVFLDPSSTNPVTATISSSALPTGAATSAIQTNGSQKTQIVNSANNVIGSISDGTENVLKVAQSATYFFFSSLNSTTAQLAASATFNGTIESIINQQSASIIITSDQNGTLVMTEYIDAAGTRVSRTTTSSVTAGTPYSRSFALNGNYFKVSFTNNGASTTTTLNINIAYGTIPSATALGNSQVSIDEVNGTSFSLGIKTPALSLPVTNAESQTYSASVTGYAPYTTAVDIFSITGSATKTIKIKHISIDGTQTTASNINVLLIKRSTANSGGTPATLTAVPWNSNNAAATATVRTYGGNPTMGTTVGTIQSEKLFVPTITTSGNEIKWNWYDVEKMQPPTLIGTSQVLAINFNSATIVGGNFNIDIVWTEE